MTRQTIIADSKFESGYFVSGFVASKHIKALLPILSLILLIER